MIGFRVSGLRGLGLSGLKFRAQGYTITTARGSGLGFGV